MDENGSGFAEGQHLQSTHRLWPSRSRGPWLLEFHWQVLDGRAECIGMGFRSAVPTQGHSYSARARGRMRLRGLTLTAARLRTFPIGQLIASERADYDELAPDPAFEPAGGRRPRATPSRLAEAARVYQDAWAAGEPTTKAVEKHFQISAGAARKLVWQARAKGLLPKTQSGVPRGGRTRKTRRQS